MPPKIKLGLDRLVNETKWQADLVGNVAYLGHEAAVDSTLKPGIMSLKQLLGRRLTKAFGPQHGFTSQDQDNMIETPHQHHPGLGIPVYSLYSETRTLTDDMAKNIDTLIIDLQDVGTRVYTYIWTLYQIMEYYQNREVKLIVLDRPNPIGGLTIEGNLPEAAWHSFVCRSSIPMRHGLTIGELALMFRDEIQGKFELTVIPMEGWMRYMEWPDNQLAWINPSPNLATYSSSQVYPGTVLFEGTSWSEGRGTTRSLELFGHPAINPFVELERLNNHLQKTANLSGYYLRPCYFKPTFQKFQDTSCGGFQLHCTNPSDFTPWKTAQHCLYYFYQRLDLDPFWNHDPYEYETDGLPIDYINGTTCIREWIETGASPTELVELELSGRKEFLTKRANYLLYT